jgi:DNA polymerase-1
LERTGKTILAEQVLGGVLVGRSLPATQLHRDNAEMDKRITATLLRGDPTVHFDNMHEFLDLPCLASLLTASVYQGRLLGKSLNIQAPNNAMFVLTGNSPQASGEMSKRLVPVCLQPANDSPELRTKFHHPDLSDYIQKNRRQILGCLVGMVLNWISAGKPPGQTTLGGFNKWASTVGGIMHLTGYKDWMGNAEAWRGKADTRKTDLRALVNEWFNKYGNSDRTASDVLAIAVELEVFSNVWSKKEGKAAVTSFGKSVLARHVNTPIGDYRIERCGDSQPAKYCLKPLDRGEAP